MTTGSSRSDAGGLRTRTEQRHPHWRVPARVHALAGVVFAVMSIGAQGATGSSGAAAPVALPPAPLPLSPARIELSDRTPRVVVAVRNDDNQTARFVHMQPMIWSQDGIAPHYELTPDVVAQPASLVVAPGATRTVVVELRSSTRGLLGADFQLFWQAHAQPPSPASRSNERPAP